jgi:hypothetical protein
MQTVEEKMLSLIDSLNTKKRFKHISIYLSKHGMQSQFNMVTQKLGLLKKVSDGWIWLGGSPDMTMIDNIVMELRKIRYNKEYEETYTEKYIELRNKAASLGYKSNSPVASAAFDLGNGNSRIGIRKLKNINLK